MKTVSSIRSAKLPRYMRVWTQSTYPGTTQSSPISRSWTESATYGDNIPNWRKLLRDGVGVTTTLSAVRQQVRFVPGFVLMLHSSPFGDNYAVIGVLGAGGTSFGVDPLTLSETSADNKAKAYFVKHADQVNHTFQGGVVLGEIAKTLHGIRHPAEALRKAVTTYRREALKLRNELLLARNSGLFRGVNLASAARAEKHRQLIASTTSALSGLWLEAQFHWRPLVSDVNDGLRTVVDRYQVRPLLQRVTGVGEVKTSSTSLRDDGLYPGFPLAFRFESRSETLVKVIYRGAVQVTQAAPGSINAEALGFSLSAFAPTVWELCPYSWLVDYFSNIGDVISAWSFLRGSLKWVSKTTRRSTTQVEHCVGLSPAYSPGPWKISQLGSTVVHERVAVERAPYGGSLVPSFEVQIPGLSTKWINLGALLANRLADRVL